MLKFVSHVYTRTLLRAFLAALIFSTFTLSLYAEEEEGLIGTDDRAKTLVEESVKSTTGEEFKPWFVYPLTEYLSTHEELLFIIQAAGGAGALGYFIGVLQPRKAQS